MSDAPDSIVLTNSRGFVIAIIVISAVYAMIMLAMMIYILWNRHHPLLKLAQAPFLAVQMGCAVIATSSVFVHLPLNDTICSLQGVLIHLPLTVLAATLVGRLWRSYSVLSVALRFARKDSDKQARGAWVLDFLGLLANLPLLCRRKKPIQRRRSLKTQVTSFDLTRLIVLLSLPQLIIQIVGFAIEPRGLDLDSSPSGLISRQECEVHWSVWAGVLYLIFVFCLALFVAWVARDLPSILNEKDAIFQACSICIVLGFVDILCVLLVSSPTTNPDVISLLWVLLTFGIVSSIVWLIMWPKIARVRAGGKVIVSNLLNQPAGGINSGNSRDCIVQHNIVLQQNEAPPRRIEAQMLNLKDLLMRLCCQSLAGEPISLSDWRLLKSSVQIFQDNLSLIEFGWTRADEQESKSEEHASMPDEDTSEHL